MFRAGCSEQCVTLPDWFETVESAPSLPLLGTELANSQRFGSRALCKSRRSRGLLTMKSSEVNIPFWLTDERCSPTFKRRWCTSFVIVAVLHTCRLEMNMNVWNPSLPSLFDSKYHGDTHCPSANQCLNILSLFIALPAVISRAGFDTVGCQRRGGLALLPPSLP